MNNSLSMWFICFEKRGRGARAGAREREREKERKREREGGREREREKCDSPFDLNESRLAFRSKGERKRERDKIERRVVTPSDACFIRYIDISIFTRAGATARARAKARKRERDDEKESRDSFRCILYVIQIFANVICFVSPHRCATFTWEREREFYTRSDAFYTRYLYICIYESWSESKSESERKKERKKEIKRKRVESRDSFRCGSNAFLSFFPGRFHFFLHTRRTHTHPRATPMEKNEASPNVGTDKRKHTEKKIDILHGNTNARIRQKVRKLQIAILQIADVRGRDTPSILLWGGYDE